MSRRSAFQLLMVCLVVLLAGCGSSAPRTRPADFALEFRWAEGSLPPPYYYEYTITIDNAGNGTVVFSPDWDFENPPVWTETFSLDAAALDALYAAFRDNGLFDRDWRQNELPPVGGGAESLTVTANGKMYEVPYFVAQGQSSAAGVIKGSVPLVVPQQIWDDLYARRDQYVAEHEEG
jgi:hypothetical protein